MEGPDKVSRFPNICADCSSGNLTIRIRLRNRRFLHQTNIHWLGNLAVAYNDHLTLRLASCSFGHHTLVADQHLHIPGAVCSHWYRILLFCQRKQYKRLLL